MPSLVSTLALEYMVGLKYPNTVAQYKVYHGCLEGDSSTGLSTNPLPPEHISTIPSGCGCLPLAIHGVVQELVSIRIGRKRIAPRGMLRRAPPTILLGTVYSLFPKQKLIRFPCVIMSCSTADVKDTGRDSCLNSVHTQAESVQTLRG